jgi:hypothetical protein
VRARPHHAGENEMKYVLQLIVVLAVAFCFLAIPCIAQEMTDSSMSNMNMKDMFVHPFLAHMSLPDPVGEVSLRVTAYQTRMNRMTQSDFAVHIETALFKRLGLHLRADGIKYGDFSDVMLQYAVITDKGSHNGVSVFGELNLPTGMIKSERYKGVIGISARLTARNFMVWDGNVEYGPKDKLTEFENAFVFRASATLYPILEFRGQADNNMTTAYFMPALKFKINDGSAIGVGFQAAILDEREYDTQALLTYDFMF